MEAPPKGRWWLVAAQLMLGAAIGAVPAGLPLFSSTAKLDPWIRPVYASAVGVCALLAAICFLAYRSVREQRADSIAAIKEDLDDLLSGYPSPLEAPSSPLAWLRPVLVAVRAQARDNIRKTQVVLDAGEYWTFTQTSSSAPETKAWKENSELLGAEPELEVVCEKGRVAHQEVERILSARSMSFLGARRKRTVQPEDRLPEVLASLRDFDQEATAAIDRVGD